MANINNANDINSSAELFTSLEFGSNCIRLIREINDQLQCNEGQDIEHYLTSESSNENSEIIAFLQEILSNDK